MIPRETARLRADIRAEIAGITPCDPREAADRQAALDWLDSGAELFRQIKPATPPQHLVSYFAVMDGPHLLLVDHRSAGLWLPPGGHVEPGEHPAETVRREAMEELGLVAEFLVPGPVFLTITRTVGAMQHLDVSLWYVLKARREAALDWDREEFHGISWFAPGKVPLGRTDPELGRFLRKLAVMGGEDG